MEEKGHYRENGKLLFLIAGVLSKRVNHKKTFKLMLKQLLVKVQSARILRIQRILKSLMYF